jgi:hypothetical protein
MRRAAGHCTLVLTEAAPAKMIAGRIDFPIAPRCKLILKSIQNFMGGSS